VINIPITSGSLDAKISICQNFYRHSTNFKFFVTMLALLRTKFLLPTFYVFFRVISKKRKKSCFLKSEHCPLVPVYGHKYSFFATKMHKTLHFYWQIQKNFSPQTPTPSWRPTLGLSTPCSFLSILIRRTGVT